MLSYKQDRKGRTQLDITILFFVLRDNGIYFDGLQVLGR
jgi:hypothetical protein